MKYLSLPRRLLIWIVTVLPTAGFTSSIVITSLVKYGYMPMTDEVHQMYIQSIFAFLICGIGVFSSFMIIVFPNRGEGQKQRGIISRARDSDSKLDAPDGG